MVMDQGKSIDLIGRDSRDCTHNKERPHENMVSRHHKPGESLILDFESAKL